MKIEIPQMQPWFDDNERLAINDYMLEQGFLTEFKRTQLFEDSIAKFTGAKHCIVVNNGTISLTLAALALGITHGDEVLVPNYTMVATPNSIKMIGANPIFVDICPSTLWIDFELMQKYITNKTKAIILVSPNGRSPNIDIDKYLEFSNAHDIPIIEDAAQSLGSFYKDGKHIGTKGNIGSFSFSMPKIITTGQGGALITDSDELAVKLRRLKDFGRTSGGLDFHETIGFNSKFTELQAVIGLEQMKKLPRRISLKKEIWKYLQENLSDIEGFKLFYNDTSLVSPWFIDSLCERRDDLKEFLAINGIGSREMYPPLNEQPCYNISGNFPVSKKIGKSGLWLPSYAQLTKPELDRIIETITNFYNQ